MATPREELDQLRALDRGGKEQPTKQATGNSPREELEQLRALDKGITLPGFGGQKVDISTDDGLREIMRFMGRDPDFSQAGVKNASFRAGLSRMDTPEEKEAFLIKNVGKEGYTRDSSGNIALTLKGMKSLGVEGDRPTVVDEPGLTRYDIADLRGDAPAIVGGVAGGIASGGLGFIPALGLTALTTAGAKGIDEAADALRGENLQKADEVAKDLAAEAALAATGETIFRGILAPLGRKILAPNRSVLKPGAAELAQDAADIGVRPKVGNLINRPVVTRIGGMVDTIFGDINAAKNSVALNKQISQLRQSFGRQVDNALDLGKAIKDDIVLARKSFGKAARAKFALVDELAGNQKLITTTPLKVQAKELIESLPQNTKGKPILVSPERVRDLSSILDLPDNITVEQLQALRTTLMDRIDDSLTPGMGSREANLLVKTANNTVDDTITQLSKSVKPNDVLPRQALEALKDARSFYAKGIRKFDNATVARIAKDPSLAGSLDPEKVVDVLFKKGSVTPIKRVFDVVPPSASERIKTSAMNKILDSAYKESGDPLVTSIFDGTGFIKTLNSYGTDTLEAMFGKEKTKELFRLGRVIQVASKPKGASGGLVAASIAVRPLQNLGRLAKLRIMAQIINSERGIKWLTQGLEAPKTRAGVSSLARFATQLEMLANDEANLE